MMRRSSRDLRSGPARSILIDPPMPRLSACCYFAEWNPVSAIAEHAPSHSGISRTNNCQEYDSSARRRYTLSSEFGSAGMGIVFASKLLLLE